MEAYLEYFKTLRNEINLRIKIHSYFTISKIIACAALLGHLINKTTVNSYALLSVPVLAFSLDLVICHNITTINNIGRFIRDEIESKIFEEKFSYERTAQSRKTGLFDLIDRFGQVFITYIFSILSLSLSSFTWFSFIFVVFLCVIDGAIMTSAIASD